MSVVCVMDKMVTTDIEAEGEMLSGVNRVLSLACVLGCLKGTTIYAKSWST